LTVEIIRAIALGSILEIKVGKPIVITLGNLDRVKIGSALDKLLGSTISPALGIIVLG